MKLRECSQETSTVSRAAMDHRSVALAKRLGPRSSMSLPALGKLLVMMVATLLVSSVDAQNATPCPDPIPTGMYIDTGEGKCKMHPAGKKGNTGSSSSSNCGSNEWSSQASTSCEALPDGYKSSSSSTTPTMCDPTSSSGYREGSMSRSTCASCPTDNVCSYKSKTSCGAGKYFNKTTRKGSCQLCPNGWKCPGGNTADSKCPAGTASNANKTDCTACGAGQYCPTGRNDDILPCPDGTYSLASATFCLPCPPGMDCTSKNSATTACDTGKFNVGGQKTCTTCPAGFQCLAKDKDPVPCQAGEYSITGQTTCKQCDLNKQCTAIQSTTQAACSAGFTADSSLGMIHCKKCPAGFKCAGSSAKVACTGTSDYSLPGATDCSTVTSGNQVYRSGSDSGNDRTPMICNPGYYSKSSTTFKCTECPYGKKCTGRTDFTSCADNELCPKGTVSPAAACPVHINCTDAAFPQCAAGKYLTSTSGTCSNCPKGNTCHSRGPVATALVIATYPANLNFYSALGQTTSFICPGGFECRTNSNGQATACATGKFSGEGDIDCHTCVVPYACPQPEMPLEGRINCQNVRGYYQDATDQTACKVCPPGYKCPYGTANKVACNQTNLDMWFAQGASEFCRPCPPGHYCPDTNLPKMVPCELGYFSVGKQKSCTICPAGFSCNFIKFTACPDHMWSNKGDQYCHYNPVGKKNVYGTGAGTSGAATATSYSAAGLVKFLACDNGQYSLFGRGECQDCPKGHYCPDPIYQPIQCEPGKFQGAAKQTACVNCPSGEWSLFGQWECYKCPAGHACASAAVPPVKCQHGMFSIAGASSCTIGAATNFELKSGSVTANPADNACDVGMTCLNGGIDGTGPTVVGRTKCKDGKYNPVRGGACDQSCPAGSFCPPGYPGKLLCPPGHFCEALAEYPTQLPEKFFGRKWGAVSNSDGAVACPAGYVCPAGTVVPLSCPPGQACAANTGTTSAAVVCPINEFSGSEPLTSIASCLPCWRGHYCPAGSQYPTDIWIGKMNPAANKGLWSDSIKTIEGQWSPWNTASRLESGLYCPPGYWCTKSTPKWPAWIVQGGKTPGVSDWLGEVGPYQWNTNPCPAGKWDDRIGQSSNACKQCPAGWACTVGTNPVSNNKQKCKPGHFCLAGSVKDTNAKCPAGTYSNVWGLESNTGCRSCPAGKYCLEGSTAPSGVCPAGYYCKMGTISATGGVKCPAGTYANPAITGMMTVNECIICPVGNYCPVSPGTFLQIPIVCPVGTYSSYVKLSTVGGATGCKDCPKGFKCTTAGLITPVQCGIGNYQDAVKQITCKVCPAGSYCHKAASIVPVTCAMGYLCPNASLSERPYHLHATYSCPRGYWCAGGTAVAVACLPGTYQPKYGGESISDCLQTPAGFYTALPASIEYFKFKCPAAYWCSAGTGNILTTPGRSCPAKTFRSQTQGTQVSDCGDCPSGFYCPVGTAQPKKCSKGYYCPAKSSDGLPCLTGSFGTAYGLAQATDCQSCYGGRYCEAFGLTEVEGNCDARFYCVDGSNVASPRAAFVGDKGGECPQGGYCPIGSKFPRPCKPGRFLGPLSNGYFAAKSLESSCADCPPGEFCDGSPEPTRTDIANELVKKNLPKALPTGDCTAGFYCTGKSTHPQQFICQQGEWSATKSSGCNQAAPGFFIPKEKSSSQTPCTAGYYCPQDTTVANKVQNYARNGLVNRGCFEPIICPAGYFCIAQSSTYNASNQKCPQGTYSNMEGLRMSSQCFDCKEGWYCSGTALTAPTAMCNAGYYCILGASVASPSVSATATKRYGPCPFYHYCEQVTSPANLAMGPGYGIPCPPGKFTRATASSAKTSVTSCVDQVPGSWSNTITGHDAGTSTAQNPMPTSPTVITATGMTVYLNAGAANPHLMSGLCQIGYYCTTGSVWPTDKDKGCAIGKKCVAGVFQETVCAAGTYQPNPIQGTCYPCPAGYACPDAAAASLNLNTLHCAPGKYCPEGTGAAGANANGIVCPAGTFRTAKGAFNLSMCIPSPAGFYQDLTGQTQVNPTTQLCNAGYFCKVGSIKGNPSGSGDVNYGGRCRAGYYCPVGSSVEILCTPGYACTAAALAAPDYDCAAGYYCRRGLDSSSVGTKRKGCPAGFYCPVKSGEPTPCPAGTWSNGLLKTQLSDCTDCTAGKFCSNVARTTDGQPCIQGFTCPAKSTHGKVIICPKGFKCVAGRATPEACSIAANNYQDEFGAIACKTCPAGYECLKELASTYATVTPNLTTDISISKTRCTPNTAGTNYYCPVGKSDRTACPAGTYNYFDKSGVLGDCWSCPPGYFCPLTSANQFLKIQECPAGKWCNGVAGNVSTHTPAACPSKYYCPQGSATPVPCDNGSYCTATDLVLPEGKCTAGYTCVQTVWCPNAGCMNSRTYGCINSDSNTVYGTVRKCVEGAASGTGTQCPAGHYCPTGSIVPVPCPIGTYRSASQGTTKSDCQACDAGWSCEHRGLTSKGIQCKSGYFCPSASDLAYNEECPVGNKCPAGSAAAIPCAIGTYQPNSIQSSCKACPAGYYCHKTQMQLPQICPKGWFCPANTGIYNADNTRACPLGTFNDQEGVIDATGCQPCPYGKYCDQIALVSGQQGKPCTILKKCYGGRNATNMASCGVGDYCPAGTAVPGACPPGQYSTTNSAMGTLTCTRCDVKKYCPEWGMTSATQVTCSPGYLCKGGAVHPSVNDDVTVSLCPVGNTCLSTRTTVQEPCAAGTYQNMKGQTSCNACIAGFNCPIAGLELPVPCVEGYYCPAGTHPIPKCPAGTYNSLKYAKAVTDCYPCPPGKYCEIGSTAFTGYCDAGYVCTGGSAVKTPTGTFDKTDYAQAKSGPCPAGHFCKRGSSFPEKCAAGTYQDTTGQSTCKDCPAGAYCGTAGMTTAGAPCADGYVCFGKSVYAQPYDYITGRLCNAGSSCKLGFETKCPGGTYTPVKGLADCIPCPPGYYCNNTKGTSEPKLCTTFNFCPIGSTTPTPCRAGTYTESFMKGLEASFQCAPCPTGFFCPSGAYDGSNKCAAGYYCHSGASAANQAVNLCPMGYYCPEGALLPTECPNGKFSERGAGSEAGCTLCNAGYYCVREVNIAYKVKCPPGHYCKEGEMYPRPCPKGTANPNEKGDKIEKCQVCPAGTNCNKAGIARHENNLCPPGYYCPKKTFSPIACPAGTWRPNQGGRAAGPIVYTRKQNNTLEAGCYFCLPGYYCPKRATIIPEVCRAGTYCPRIPGIGTKNCPPGFYCPAASGKPTPCPKGFYCAGRSDKYFKCKNGTYCPVESSSEIPCPAGMYGSGSINNFSIATGCRACGRGLYSTEGVLNKCLDCTEGYVCLGNTSSRYPSNKKKYKGYQCPVGFFCPKGSFVERPCPPGRYAKSEGTVSEDKCLPCKLNSYNDAFGQPGCKRCGPTSTADGYATTCKCVGKNREFVKSLGSCLCERGYKTKNNAPNQDSVEDCEAQSKRTCTPDQDVDSRGQCINKKEQGPICEKQCPKGTGKLVQGTGLCACDSITDITQVCGIKCQKTTPKLRLQRNGMLSVNDPTSNKGDQSIDPSKIEGYYGDFKCKPAEGSTECKTFTLGMSDAGDFEFDYGTNANILKATGLTDNTDRRKSTSFLSNFHRFMVDPKSLKGRRYLQAAQNNKLQNPALCIKMGDVVFFNVKASARSYPRYFKDSILNTNKKFDYGAFEELQNMIEVKGVNVQTFSFAFREEGIYMFENASSGTMTVIGVVKPSQVCSNVVNGVGASMITQQSLAELGIQSQDNSVDPDWVFIGLSFMIINLIIYAFIGLIIWTYNLNQKRADIASQEGMVGHSGSIYYDKINHLLEDSKQTRCFGLCRKNKQAENRIDAEDLQENKKVYSMSYADLARLKENLDNAQETLAKQLRDKEKRSRARRQGPQFDEDGNEVENWVPDDDEEKLLTEFEELMDFVRENRKTIGYVADEDKDAQRAAEAAIEGEGENEADNAATRTQRTVNKMLGKQMAQEQDFANASAEAIRKQQEAAFGAQLAENEAAKNKLLDQYRDKLANGNLSADERAAILAEMEGKMAMINNMIEGEEQQQNSALADALARRRAKKEKLKNVINNLAAQKDSAIEKTDEKRQEILNQESADIFKIEKELDMERKAGSKEIENDVESEKQRRLAAAEKRLNDFKKRSGGDNDDKFADMLNEYGELVKKVDQDLENEKELQYSQLEEKLAARRRQRKQEIGDKARNMESSLNKNSVESRQDLQEQLNQVESMLQPVRNEEERVARITEGVQVSSAINQDAIVQRDTINLSQEGQSAQAQLLKMALDKEIENMQAKTEKENQVRRMEVEQQREMIRKRLENPGMDENERARIMKQLAAFEDNLKSQLQQENENQSNKLKEALEKRRARKKKLGDKVSNEKQQIILDRYKQGTAGKVRVNADEDGTNAMAQKLITGFDSNEVVQVTENYMDKKTQQELIDLMNALFDERSRALRKYMFELLAQKSVDLEDLSQEFEPQKELLRSKRSKGLIDEDDFTRQMERLNAEMAERKMDLDIEYSDKEKAVTEELEKIKLDAETEQKKILKDRQTQEKLVMFKKLMEATGEENASVKAYLQKQMNESEKELDAFKRKADRDKQKAMDDMEADKEAQMQALVNRQERMFNWEDKMKKQEMQFMDQFEQQKNSLKAKKLADQQKELLKDMNQKDVDVMLARHKRELEAIEEALAAEQKRQMDQMKEQMKSRNAKLAKDKALRQIKLAEIQKSKLREAAAARAANTGNAASGGGAVTEDERERRIARCVEKADMLQKLIQKQAYSRPIYVRRHVMNMQKLNGAYGLNAMGDWGVSQAAESEMSDITVDTQRDLMSMLTSAKNITYKLLLDHVDNTQTNYDVVRDKKGLRTKDQAQAAAGAKPTGISSDLLDGLKGQKGDF